jgi:glucose/arabinose dehydrogenase
MRIQGAVRWVLSCGVLFGWTNSVDAALSVELVSSAFSRPVFVTSPPGDATRLFVLEQHAGRIRIFDRTTQSIKTTPFLIITALNRSSEEGLLGMAFHPGYLTNGYFYLNITPSGGTRRTEILRFQAQGDPATSDLADAGSRKLILTFNQPESNHNGGWMGFGPDGYLYIATGDGGGANDQHGTIGNGQNRGTLLGKILRIDVDGADPYAVPDGNPFKGHATYADEIWAFGLRNPWRCSFDRETGHLWIGDVGQGAREEIDVIPEGVAGLNFGWRPREGAIQTPAYPNEQPVTPAVNPVTDYPRTLGYSVTGGYVYRGNAVPELRGKYIFSDYGSARFWTITPDATGTNGTRAEITTDLDPSPRRISDVSSFGEDSDGELYICDLNGTDGTSGAVFRIVAEGAAAPRISAVQAEGNQFVLRFEAVAGQSYTLESRDSLGASAAWTNPQVIASAATNRTLSVTNTLTGTERYFRLRSE